MTTKEQYKVYLESVAWKKLRSLAMLRAGFQCELCNQQATEAHHIKYPKNLSEDSLDNLLVCCTACHQKQHGIRDGGERNLRRTIRKRINLPTDGIPLDYDGSRSYLGFEMSGWQGDIFDEKCNKYNFNLFTRFIDYMPSKFNISNFKLWSWKGNIWWGGKDFDEEKEFNGWSTEDIIFWIISNYGKYRKIGNMEGFKEYKKISEEELKEEDNDGDSL